MFDIWCTCNEVIYLKKNLKIMSFVAATSKYLKIINIKMSYKDYVNIIVSQWWWDTCDMSLNVKIYKLDKN